MGPLIRKVMRFLVSPKDFRAHARRLGSDSKSQGFQQCTTCSDAFSLQESLSEEARNTRTRTHSYYFIKWLNGVSSCPAERGPRPTHMVSL